MNGRALYVDPALYSRVFPPDAGEAAFFTALLKAVPPGAAVLDAGCGTASLAAMLPLQVVGLDRCRELLRAAPAPVQTVEADLTALPFRKGTLGGAFSRLFGYGYALGEVPGWAAAIAEELGRVLRPGAPVALEVPLAHRPSRLQGIEERAVLPGGLAYRFRYLDVLEETAFGTVLATRIEVRDPAGEEWHLAAPLHVYTPEGARAWLAHAGITEVRFHAPYDLASGTAEPPEDCLRAVAVGVHQRKSVRIMLPAQRAIT